jgi:hypothetical protein
LDSVGGLGLKLVLLQGQLQLENGNLGWEGQEMSHHQSPRAARSSLQEFIFSFLLILSWQRGRFDQLLLVGGKRSSESSLNSTQGRFILADFRAKF